MRAVVIFGCCIFGTFFSSNLFAAVLAVRTTTPTLVVKEPLIAPTVVAPAPTISVKEPVTTIMVREPVTAPLVKEPTTSISVKEPTVRILIKEPITALLVKTPTPAVTVREPVTAVRIRETATIVIKEPRLTPTSDKGSAGQFNPGGKSAVVRNIDADVSGKKPLKINLSTDAKGKGIVPGHAYTITGTNKDSSGAEYVVVRNPWGSDGNADVEVGKDLSKMLEIGKAGQMADYLIAFSGSLDDKNQDKRYMINKLGQMDEIAQTLTGHLKNLPGDNLSPDYSGSTGTLSKKKLNSMTLDELQKNMKIQTGQFQMISEILQKHRNKNTWEEIQDAANGWVEADGETGQSNPEDFMGPSGTGYEPGRETGMSREDIGNFIPVRENDMEQVRNNRTETMTAFENFDQKSNQLFNILASVLKAMKEMQAGTTRNLL